MDSPPPARARDGSSLPRVRAVSRAVAILRAFSPDQPYLALSEIVRKTGLDAGTTRRLLVTLRDEGLIHQDAATGRYSGSVGLLELGAAVPESLSLKDLLDPHLASLATETGTTVYLSVVRGDSAVCLARYHGQHAVEVRWWAVGESRAFNIGTGPRVLLAYLDAVSQKRFFSSQLTLLDGSPDHDIGQLREEIRRIRTDGYLVKHDEIAQGLSALAVPLLDARSNCVAAVSLGGLTPKFIGAALNETLSTVNQAVKGMRAAQTNATS